MPLIPRFDEEAPPASFTASGRGFFLCRRKERGVLFLYGAKAMRLGCRDGLFLGCDLIQTASPYSAKAMRPGWQTGSSLERDCLSSTAQRR